MQGIIFPLQQEVSVPVRSQQQASEQIHWHPQPASTAIKQNDRINKKKPHRGGFFKTLLVVLIGIFAAGVLGGALLSQSTGVIGGYLKQLATAYLKTRQSQPVLQLYANCFFSMLLLHAAMLWSSFSSIGFIPAVLLLAGKGITIGCVTAELYFAKEAMFSQLLGLLPYHALSSVLALFMAFAASKQASKLFCIHFLHDRTNKYQVSDSVYFFLAVTAGSFFSALLFCLGCFLPAF